MISAFCEKGAFGTILIDLEKRVPVDVLPAPRG
jgi:hypothetical protein